MIWIVVFCEDLWYCWDRGGGVLRRGGGGIGVRGFVGRVGPWGWREVGGLLGGGGWGVWMMRIMRWVSWEGYCVKRLVKRGKDECWGGEGDGLAGAKCRCGVSRLCCPRSIIQRGLYKFEKETRMKNLALDSKRIMNDWNEVLWTENEIASMKSASLGEFVIHVI